MFVLLAGGVVHFRMIQIRITDVRNRRTRARLRLKLLRMAIRQPFRFQAVVPLFAEFRTVLPQIVGFPVQTDVSLIGRLVTTISRFFCHFSDRTFRKCVVLQFCNCVVLHVFHLEYCAQETAPGIVFINDSLGKLEYTYLGSNQKPSVP